MTGSPRRNVKNDVTPSNPTGKIRALLCFSLALLAVPLAPVGRIEAKSCAAMQKELGELRQEYHRTAVSESPKPTFDVLAEILDRIVELKRSMSGANCRIPDRNAASLSKEEHKKPRVAEQKKRSGGGGSSQKR
jgi:hypothetical protein